MPQIKITHVVSFSSEDTKHVANNLLNTDTSKKWICKTAGEAFASITLQLEKVTKISGVDVGNEKSAFVEVLVGRSNFEESDFQPLLAMSSFMTPMEAINLSNSNRVRLFTQKDLNQSVRDEKWDRVKFVCKQPFNKQVQYGLSLITLHCPQEHTEDVVSLGKFVLRPSSPDSLRVGSLFERRKELAKASPKLSVAQEIKQASTPEWQEKNGPVKCRPADIKPSTNNSLSKKDTTVKNRNSLNLFYNSEDDEPNEKIDRIVELKRKEDEKNKVEQQTKKAAKSQKKGSKSEVNEVSNAFSANHGESSKRSNKRKQNSTTPVLKKRKVLQKPFNELMSNVVFTISGIVNPERGTLRQMALNMGAKYRPDWDSTCTHLICAFANTPKFQQVKGKGKIVKKNWIADCNYQRKKIPWRRYALDRDDIGKSESEDEISELIEESSTEIPKINSHSGSDTEDEIERVLANKENTVVDDFDVDTEEEKLERNSVDVKIEFDNIFKSKIFFVDSSITKSEKIKLECTIKSTNGEIASNASNKVDFIITENAESAKNLKDRFPEVKLVSPQWIYICYENKNMENIDEYLLI